MSVHPHTPQLCSDSPRFLTIYVKTRVATVPVPPGGAARRRRCSAGLHQRRAAAAGAEGRRDPPGAGGGHQTGAAAHPAPRPARLPGLPAALHAHSQVSHLQPARRLRQPLNVSVAAACGSGISVTAAIIGKSEIL